MAPNYIVRNGSGRVTYLDTKLLETHFPEHIPANFPDAPCLVRQLICRTNGIGYKYFRSIDSRRSRELLGLSKKKNNSTPTFWGRPIYFTDWTPNDSSIFAEYRPELNACTNACLIICIDRLFKLCIRIIRLVQRSMIHSRSRHSVRAPPRYSSILNSISRVIAPSVHSRCLVSGMSSLNSFC
jgi:hypothetical protein